LNARKVLIAVCALVAVSLSSCGTARRAGKDAFVGIISPVLIIYGGATDGYTSAVGVRNGLGGGSAVEVVAFPFTFLYHAFEHTIYAVIHIVDLPLCLFYGAAELGPNGPQVKPLDFYQGTWFDKESDKAVPSGTDATTGESVPPGYNR
jgi:predicted small secreted protein